MNSSDQARLIVQSVQRRLIAALNHYEQSEAAGRALGWDETIHDGDVSVWCYEGDGVSREQVDTTG